MQSKPRDSQTVKNQAFIATAKEITAEWITKALATQYPDVVVTSLKQHDIIIGAQTKIKLTLSYNKVGRDLAIPQSLVLKADIKEFGLGPVANVRFNEPRAYRDLVPTLGVESPAIWSLATGEQGPAYTLMDDLEAKGCQFMHLANPISAKLAARFLKSMAQIHARWWDAPELDDEGYFGDVRVPLSGFFEKFIANKLSPENFTEFLKLPRAAATPKELRDPERIHRGLMRLGQHHSTMPRCIVHGDTHLNNLYVTANGKPGFYDWSPRRTAWVQDVAYFITAGLDIRERRQKEQRLIKHYLGCLVSLGVKAPGFRDAWMAYRRELLWGMFVFLTNGPTQTEYSNTAAATRFAAAMLDHDTNRLLGV